jgi:hypothetical protein
MIRVCLIVQSSSSDDKCVKDRKEKKQKAQQS